MSLQEYKHLFDLIPQVQMLKNTINEMEKIIESKDSQLKYLQKMHQRKHSECINVSNLSTVSVFL